MLNPVSPPRQSSNLRLVSWAPNTERVTWKAKNNSWDLEKCGVIRIHGH